MNKIKLFHSYHFHQDKQLTNHQGNNYNSKGETIRDDNNEVHVEPSNEFDGQPRGYQMNNHVDYIGFNREDDPNSSGESGNGGEQNNRMTMTTINTESPLDLRSHLSSLSSTGKKRSSVMLNRLKFVLHKAHKVDPSPHSNDRLSRSGEVGKGFPDKSSGSKDNLMVKCFFNGVSCF